MTVLYVPGPPNFTETLVRSILTQINRFVIFRELCKNCSFLFIPFILLNYRGLKIVEKFVDRDGRTAPIS